MRRRRQAVVATAIALSLIAAWTMLASSGALDSAFRHKENQDQPVAIASFNSNSPSKEYVYAGGRLVATDECDYSISPTSSFFTYGGGDGTVNVTAPMECEWEVTNIPSWITLTWAGNGKGSDVVTFLVRENFTGSAREAIFTIAGLGFTVLQNSNFANCAYELSPIFANFSSSGGIGTINVTVDSHCGWQAVSNKSWVTVTSGNLGIGNGTVTYSVAVNTTGITRTAAITIANQTVNVKQKAT